MRFFTSDNHFWHRNVIQYCNRPWATVEEMNQGMVDRWNSVVGPDDEVYIIGDFSLSYQGAEMVKYLNGKVKYLIPGNHDKCHQVFYKKSEEKRKNSFNRYTQMGFIVLPEYYSTILKHEGEEIAAQICHFPFVEDHGNFEKTPSFMALRPKPAEDLVQVLLHGHVHNHWKVRRFFTERGCYPMINVGVDVWDWTPIAEPDLFKFCKAELEMAQLDFATRPKGENYEGT